MGFETEDSLDFLTNLGTNDDRAHVLVLSDEPSGELLDKITVNVSDSEESARAELRKVGMPPDRVTDAASPRRPDTS